MSRQMLAEVITLINGLSVATGETHERIPDTIGFLIRYDRESEPESEEHDRLRLSITSPDLESLAEFNHAAFFAIDVASGSVIGHDALKIGNSTSTERWALVRRIPKDKMIMMKLV